METPENEKPDKCPHCGMWTAKEVVELSPAYMWDCPNCGRENFQRSVLLAMTDEDRLEMDLAPNEVGSWQSYPNIVVCRFCEQQYQTKHISDDGEGDEDDEPSDDE